MTAVAARRSLVGFWYATGPEGAPFSADDPRWNVHRVVVDDPAWPTVTIENAGGQRFPLTRALAEAIALPPSDLRRTDL